MLGLLREVTRGRRLLELIALIDQRGTHLCLVLLGGDSHDICDAFNTSSLDGF